MALTERDRIAWEFVTMFKLVKIEQAARLSYDGKYQICCNRLRKMKEDGIIYAKKNVFEQGTLYCDSPRRNLKQYYHYMIRNEAYLKFREETEINEVDVEPTFGSVQADMVLIGFYKGKRYFYLVEVDTEAKNRIDYDKYNNFFIKEWREYFNRKPIVLYVTNLEVKKEKANYDFQVVKEDLSNLIEVLEQNPF